MLSIVTRNGAVEWHVGEPFPDLRKHGPVIRFQADGHELRFMLGALEAHIDEAYNYAVNNEPLNRG